MAKSRARHSAPGSGTPRVSRGVWVISAASGLLLVCSILASIAMPAASSGSAAGVVASRAATSTFDLKGFAKGPTKPTPAPAGVVLPRTGQEQNAVADPYNHSPTSCPSGMVAGSTDSAGNQANCRAPVAPSSSPPPASGPLPSAPPAALPGG